MEPHESFIVFLDRTYSGLSHHSLSPFSQETSHTVLLYSPFPSQLRIEELSPTPIFFPASFFMTVLSNGRLSPFVPSQALDQLPLSFYELLRPSSPRNPLLLLHMLPTDRFSNLPFSLQRETPSPPLPNV